jgi:hypothetical protein
MADYAYLSMGAYPLEDHKLVHRNLGITRLIAFDMEASVVSRQEFNKPIDSCRCIVRKSGEVVSNLSSVLEECDFADSTGVIVWLDYTMPKMLGEQVREFESLLDALTTGDVVRVTVNAHPQELNDAPSAKPTTIEERRAKQFGNLKNRIGDYMPSEATADDMTIEGLPRILARSFAKAALNAFPVSGNLTFRPLSVVRYADGQQMLSITGVVADRTDEGEMLSRLGLATWPFASDIWTDIHNLVVPDLTLRERLFLEREVSTKSVAEIVATLGFESAGDIEVSQFIDNYKNYYRFYPTLLTAEL